jgi:hypothetical protein
VPTVAPLDFDIRLPEQHDGAEPPRNRSPELASACPTRAGHHLSNEFVARAAALGRKCAVNTAARAPSRTSLTASSLNSRPNRLRSIVHLRFHHT